VRQRDRHTHTHTHTKREKEREGEGERGKERDGHSSRHVFQEASKGDLTASQQNKYTFLSQLSKKEVSESLDTEGTAFPKKKMQKATYKKPKKGDSKLGKDHHVPDALHNIGDGALLVASWPGAIWPALVFLGARECIDDGVAQTESERAWNPIKGESEWQCIRKLR
jgi:hypothetical protein